MTFTLSDTDKAVQTRLNTWGIKYSVQYLGARTDKATDGNKPWVHDAFVITFTPADGNKPVASFDYKTGIGHRISADTFQAKSRDLKESNAHLKAHADIAGFTRSKFGVELNRGHVAAWVPAPTAASVLCSIILDASALDTNPQDWLSDLGYDADSIKANALYNACCDNGRKLRATFSRDQIAQLQELLQDY